MDRRDAQHLGDQAAGIAALRLAALGLARPDAELAVLAHGRAAFGRKWPVVPFEALFLLAFPFRAARAPTDAPA
ncbi:hypothetical protein [Sphingopyxis sp.]|uniref:hypothetical protein n=1 Tax=Sphingopyxis sp. TaxID=1908224 RepID=UPI00344EF0D6